MAADEIVDPAVAEVERGLAFVVRYGNLPRVRERLASTAGVKVEAAGYGVLSLLAEGGPQRPTELASVLGIDLSTFSRQAKQLEAQQLVSRSADPNDGRAAVLRLTPKGRRATVKLREARLLALQRLLEDWSEKDRRLFGTLLSRFAEQFVGMSAQ